MDTFLHRGPYDPAGGEVHFGESQEAFLFFSFHSSLLDIICWLPPFLYQGERSRLIQRADRDRTAGNPPEIWRQLV